MEGRVGSTQMPAKTRRAQACNQCRAKKIRCNGNFPCANCLDRAVDCVVTTRRRPRTAGRPNRESTDLTRRIDQIENLLHASAEKDSTTPAAVQPNSDPPKYLSEQSVISKSPTFIYHHPDGQAIEPLVVSNSSPAVLDGQDIEDESSSVYAAEALNLEYYGPRSLLSIFSKPAVTWIMSRVKTPGFNIIALRFVTDVSRTLKINDTLSSSRAPEPPPEIAWQYTKAFFEEAPAQAFGIVDRVWFESRLRAHFNNSMPDDKSYYALRNIVWASGSRIVLSKTVTSFVETWQASWAWFENALSVHTEIIFFRSSMIAVQVLILMAYYSEGMGKISLQYMLCSDAIRLSCAKGLHRQPARSWNISLHEISHRNWMFWSIYCLEKQICSRSGRPSIIDDDEISSQVPEKALSGQLGDTIYCHVLIQLIRLCSTTKKRLSSAQALRQTPAQLIETIRNLNQELDGLKRSIQPDFALDAPLETSQLPKGMTLRQAQSLQSHYFSLVLDINTPLAYPWSGVHTSIDQDMAALAQIGASCDAVARASRAAILATRQIRVDASCTALVATYTPVYCFSNLFLHILRNTTTAQSDLVLLDMALGYFSNIEFVTGLELSFRFVREMCHFARLAVEEMQKTKQGAGEINNPAELTPLSRDHIMDIVASDMVDNFPLHVRVL
ncbi:fungal-specific transcription factor domain-containing protein [Talaromyces proteolyticus]|uniref:Fungal-specific transcription factor domain-containing protein n=1 Tax=Talaromyces proteolyticus TaxID=1131652 RepID=A0AAD4KN13_9EURO|nr:fungal-specific transcription factor domain-containing protein [Talaromyces proteolyticus]KAH8691680.1 fungal-specific transcription factor domain-containing protein [Talaromyces proteolyticus]